MIKRIYAFEHEGRQVLGFDTGLDSRAFAQAKLAQFITEPGIVIFPSGKADGKAAGGADGVTEVWQVSGVAEAGGPPQAGGSGASMVVWGPAFEGERLDLLVNDSARQDAALAAVTHWIEACLRNTALPSPVPPCAVLTAADGTLLFAPPALALRCIQAEESCLSGKEWYVHPDLAGGAAFAFTAAAMLYRIFSGAPPFSAEDPELARQDIREGNFPPVRFAAPGLDEKIAGLIQRALSPADAAGPGNVVLKSAALKSAAPQNDPQAALALLSGLLEILKGADAAASLFHPLSPAESAALTKEKERFLKKKNIEVKTRRFVIRNTAIILGCAAALLIAALTARSIIKSRAERPTTAGMDSVQVVQSYYNAFGELDHPLMEACVIKGAGKGDINMVINLFVITRVRQAYEAGGVPPLISASEWKAAGMGPVDSQVFGVTDLEIEPLTGSGTADEIRCIARYTLWLPYQEGGESEAAANTSADASANAAAFAGADRPPQGVQYTDELTLIKDRGNWRIAAIDRRSE
jgi:hypothetical protein